MKPSTPTRIRIAWALAIGVDALQLGLFPISGSLSTWVDKPLDLAAMGVLWYLVGWHWALLPTFVMELVPFVELVPTWTLAVWLITRKQKSLHLRPSA
ncbi:MAG: hypothetical protein WAT51_02365 [Holophaga sp.]